MPIFKLGDQYHHCRDQARAQQRVQRRFKCIDVPQGKDEGILFAIISGESPAVEWSPEAVKLMSENGQSVARVTD